MKMQNKQTCETAPAIWERWIHWHERGQSRNASFHLFFCYICTGCPGLLCLPGAAPGPFAINLRKGSESKIRSPMRAAGSSHGFSKRANASRLVALRFPLKPYKTGYPIFRWLPSAQRFEPTRAISIRLLDFLMSPRRFMSSAKEATRGCMLLTFVSASY